MHKKLSKKVEKRALELCLALERESARSFSRLRELREERAK